MSYQSAIVELNAMVPELQSAPGQPRRKFSLNEIGILLAALSNPHRSFPSVLIAGTNGKGSTASTLAAILSASGPRVGLYTSPHLARPNERIRVDRAEIGDDAFSLHYFRVKETAERLIAKGKLKQFPSYFETLTAMAFLHFAKAGISIAVLEVGMGGRLDATNIVDPLVSVVTDISFDHMEWLGSTIAEIAREKAGIIRPGGVVVTLPQHPQANDVIGNTILELGARGVSAVPYVPPVSPGAADEMLSGARNRYFLELRDATIQIDSPLAGRHQLRNIALAVATAEELNKAGIAVTPQAIEQGIRETYWPGRLQVIEGEPEWLLDVAHNPAGAWALRAALSDRYAGRPVTFVFGVMRDKAVEEIVQILFPLAERVVVTRAQDHPRAAAPEELAAAAAKIGCKAEIALNVAAALEAARRGTAPNGVIVVTGSIYIVGEALAELSGAS